MCNLLPISNRKCEWTRIKEPSRIPLQVLLADPMANMAPGKRAACQPISGNSIRPKNKGKEIDTSETEMSQGKIR
tara:strand:+ start:3236 stop:3460 length:225 start_codon:yes stop_codon:yes gene_type:complete